MIGTELTLSLDQAKVSGQKITHRTDEFILGVDDKILIYPGENLKIAVEASIETEAGNFGGGIIAVTDLRMLFIGKGSIVGVVTAVSRAVGGGKTYFQFSRSKIDHAEEHGHIRKSCRMFVKTKGFFGGDKLEKYDVFPKGDYKEQRLLLIKCVNDFSRGISSDSSEPKFDIGGTFDGMKGEQVDIADVNSPESTPIVSRDMASSSKPSDLRCPQCFEKVEATWKTCPFCCASLPKLCPNCGEKMESDWVSCPFCNS